MKKTFGNGFIIGLLVAVGIGFAGRTATNVIMSTPWGKNIQYAFEKTTNNKLSMLKAYIDKYYIEESVEDDLVEGAYAGYVNALGDPYSAYFTKEEYIELLESSSGEYCGIGVSVSQNPETGLITIMEVYEDAPAYEAGMQSGDIVYKVSGVEVKGESLDSVVSKIKGEENTTVMITVYRASSNEYIEMEVKRARLTVPTIKYEMLNEEDKVAYIQITQFDANTDEIFEEAIEELKAQGMKSVIFDVRNNPGGQYDTVCNMLDIILPEGTIVYTLDKYGKKEEEKSDKECLDIPMTVLINENSASASEIFAGAIQDYKAGTIVGKQSFGKGIVQAIYQLEDGTAIKLTISKYYTPNGVNIHGKGITPDVEVEAQIEGDSSEENGEKKDPQLDKALEILE